MLTQGKAYSAVATKISGWWVVKATFSLALACLFFITTEVSVWSRSAAASNGPRFLTCCQTYPTDDALAAPPAAFHRYHAAIIVCGLATAFIVRGSVHFHFSPSQAWPWGYSVMCVVAATLFNKTDPSSADVSSYLQQVAFDVERVKDGVQAQIRRLKVPATAHQTEGRTDLEKHLVMGPGGAWLHSHLFPFPEGHGTLLEVERDAAGLWQPKTVLIESAGGGDWALPRYFFDSKALTRSSAKRALILSTAAPFVSRFQGILDRVLMDQDFSILNAMGRGITPGTEDTWIIEHVNNWDAENGLLMDWETGWVFLRGDKPRESITVLQEAAFTVRSLVKLFEWPANAVIHQVNPETLEWFLPWIEGLAYRLFSRTGQGLSHGTRMDMRPDEVSYLKALVEKALGKSSDTDRGESVYLEIAA